MKLHRPCELKLHITAEADQRLRALAKKHRMPIAAVARGMLEHGFRPWLDEMSGKPG